MGEEAFQEAGLEVGCSEGGRSLGAPGGCHVEHRLLQGREGRNYFFSPLPDTKAINFSIC